MSKDVGYVKTVVPITQSETCTVRLRGLFDTFVIVKTLKKRKREKMLDRIIDKGESN